MTSPDDVRRWSEELARDPGSLSFIPLGEALRQQRQHELATRVALRGLERHPHHPDAHDLLARLYVDVGDLARAFDEWHMALRYAPAHVGALKGLGFVSFNQGNLEDAERWLAEAVQADPADASIRSGLAHVRQTLGRPEPPAAAPEPTPAPASAVSEDDDLMPWERPAARAAGSSVAAVAAPRDVRASGALAAPPADRSHEARRLFADLVGGEEQSALLLDENGFVLAGEYVDAAGRDASQEVGAQLSGVSDEAGRAMRHLALGAWHALLVETSGATVAMAPAPAGGLVLIAASRTAPIGLVRRFLERAGARARALGGGDA